MSVEIATKAAWLALALLHVVPSLVAFVPALTLRLYDVEPNGDVGVLIVHRGALFAAIVVGAAYAAFVPDARRVTSLVVAISLIGFLLIYAWAGMPSGSLRTIAFADLIGFVPLALVILQAWRG